MRKTTPTSRKKKNPYGHIKKSGGKRSGLEVAVAAALTECQAGFQEEKEIEAIEFTIAKPRKYHPDFRLANGIYIESKGWFKSEDRQKHLAIKFQHPEKDIRFVFSNPNTKIGKKSTTTYGMWCEKNGFKYAKGEVPKAWIKEKCQHQYGKGEMTCLTVTYTCLKCGHTEEQDRSHQ